MNIKNLMQQAKGSRYLLFIIICYLILLSCHNRYLIHNEQNALSISKTQSSITVESQTYKLTINKSSALVTLNNKENQTYTTFPLSLQFPGTNPIDSSFRKFNWQVKSKTIFLEIFISDSLFQKYQLNCNRDYFIIEIASKIPGRTGNGVFLFRSDKQGFNTAAWEQYFSPEADNYFSSTPTVDVRADGDQQWKFTPAPLNLSFKSSAGWFSIGLTELADASLFRFKQNSLWLNFPWNKITVSEKFFNFPPVAFTFNKSPWDAISDFRKIVFKKNSQLLKKQPQVGWWFQPIISPKGEQIIYSIAGADSSYNINWLKEYFKKQLKQYENLNFTLIIEDKWCQFYGDATPAPRFKNLRALIDYVHSIGSKVILSWKAWNVEQNSCATNLRLNDGEYIDATVPYFDSYVDLCCQRIFGDESDHLNADGLQIDNLFLVREPATANYRDASKGIGFKEVYLYLESFYRHAKKYNSEALIMSTATDPHFYHVQDMVRINDDWDNKLRREKRARIITQALPGMLINGDASVLYNKIAPYHYATSAIYGVPAIHYFDQFQDGVITEKNKICISKILNFSKDKPKGKLKFIDYGNWQILDKNENVLAESALKGRGILFFTSATQANFLCLTNKNPHLVFDSQILVNVRDKNGIDIPFEDLGHGVYELKFLSKGQKYQLNFIRRGIFYP